jgi:hypothetical protein
MLFLPTQKPRRVPFPLKNAFQLISCDKKNGSIPMCLHLADHSLRETGKTNQYASHMRGCVAESAKQRVEVINVRDSFLPLRLNEIGSLIGRGE